MNPSVVLLLLVLPALASAHQPAAINIVPRLSGVESPSTIPQRMLGRPKLSSDELDFEGTNLKWQWWTGSLPDNAVSIYNGYTKNNDYICRHTCDSGYYRPSQGEFCVYSYGCEALITEEFYVLVNKDNFEILEWQEGSYGSVAWNAVKNCVDRDIYVGKNEYGLGKVHVSHRVFYLPWRTKEYIYPKDYQFLTISEDVKQDHVMDVRYHTNGLIVVDLPPEMMMNDSVKNQGCLESMVTDTLSKKSQVEHKWEHTFSLNLAGSTTFSTGIPHLAAGAVRFSAETDISVVTGTTYTESTEHVISLTIRVPPNSLCKIHMMGKKYGADIPYTARLKRTYTNGESKWTTVSGTYKSVQISEVIGVVDRCEPLPDASPC